MINNYSEEKKSDKNDMDCSRVKKKKILMM